MMQFGSFRRARMGMLRPWILSMLSDSPKNGAEIIEEMQNSGWGHRGPSPSFIYPLLDEMTKDGLIQKREDGRYEITEKGKKESNFPFGMPFGGFRPHGIDQMLGEIDGYVSYFEDLSRTDKSKLAQYQAQIHDLSVRLSKLAE